MRAGSLKRGRLIAWALCALMSSVGCATRSSNANQAQRNGVGMYTPVQQPSPPPVQYTYAPGAQPITGFAPVFTPPPPVPLPQLALGIARPVDTKALFSSPAQSRCPRFEAVPGKWVTLDCDPQRPISNARPFIRPRGFQEQVLPLSVDHRTDGLDGPLKDQQEVGTCTAFSLSTAMDNAIRRLGQREVMSPLHVWSRYRVPRIDKAGDANLEKAITSEAQWPYDPAKACRLAQQRDFDCENAYNVRNDSVDATLEGEVQRANTQGVFKLTTVESLRSSPGNPQEVAAIIAGGDSVWAAFKTHPNWQGVRLGRDGIIADYQEVDEKGHAVVLTGYRTLNGVKQFLIHNSWGPRWGDNGYGWISENMVRDHMIYAYRIQVSDARSVAPQPPPPPSNGCPTGQVRDLVYGNCMLPCPGGSAPSAGFCLPPLSNFPFPFPFPQPPAPNPPPSATAPPAQPLPPAQPTPSAQPAPPQPPPSQPAPQQARCPAGQVPDLLTGLCFLYCPNGLPPIGGLCLPW